MTPRGDVAAGGPAWRSAGAWLILLLVSASALATDLATKYWAFRHVAPAPALITRERVLEAAGRHGSLSGLVPAHDPVVVVPGVLNLTLVLNRGAVFGIGAGKRWFFIAFTALALGFALAMFGAWTRARDGIPHIALGLLIAGGLGNLYDRVIYACVRDFIHPLPGVVIPGLRWELWPYVSNIADLWLLVGIAVLMLHYLRQGGARGGA